MQKRRDFSLRFLRDVADGPMQLALFDVQLLQGLAYALLIEADRAEDDLAVAVEEIVGGVRFDAVLKSRVVVVALPFHADEECEVVRLHVLIDHICRVGAIEGDQFQSFVFQFGV